MTQCCDSVAKINKYTVIITQSSSEKKKVRRETTLVTRLLNSLVLKGAASSHNEGTVFEHCFPQHSWSVAKPQGKMLIKLQPTHLPWFWFYGLAC